MSPSFLRQLDISPRMYRIRHRQEIASKEGLCTYCPPHAGENARGKFYYKWKIKKAFQLDPKRRHYII
jgi:hypothetical protein